MRRKTLLSNKSEFINLVKQAYSVWEISRKCNYGVKTVQRFIKENKIDVSHFNKKGKQGLLYSTRLIEKKCPVCKKHFFISKLKKLNKTVCSNSCSNKFFPRGKARYKKYTTICFSNHKKQCVVCGESRIVAVHHYDENHNNNDPKNLIPLCPTCHSCYHSKQFIDTVKPKIDSYVKKYCRVV